jgi:hypothetical protein
LRMNQLSFECSEKALSHCTCPNNSLVCSYYSKFLQLGVLLDNHYWRIGDCVAKTIWE